METLYPEMKALTLHPELAKVRWDKAFQRPLDRFGHMRTICRFNPEAAERVRPGKIATICNEKYFEDYFSQLNVLRRQKKTGALAEFASPKSNTDPPSAPPFSYC